MKSDYFYSERTGLFVARKPLSLNSRSKNAALSAEVTIDWNDEGQIINIDFDDARRLLEELEATMLTPTQYWQVYQDAIDAGDQDMLNELCSDQYTEWLNRVYVSECEFIDSPDITSSYRYIGASQVSNAPYGRPGWFNPDRNVNEHGEPIDIDLFREKHVTSWKYWSPDLRVTELGICAPIRGFVTSVGKPSLDLGIPVDSRQPKLMVRECRIKPLEPVVSNDVITLFDSKDLNIKDFVKQFGYLFVTSQDSSAYKMREKVFDLLGQIALTEDVIEFAGYICPLAGKQLSYADFKQYIVSSSKRLKVAIQERSNVVFVMGHKNPDTDTVISSLFEAYRNSLQDRSTVYIPVVQATLLPKEVELLVGELAGHILLTSNVDYIEAKNSGLSRWISVDQNREPEVQKFFIAILDHHAVSESARKRDIPKTLEMLGSTAAIVARKYLGMGLQIDNGMAYLLYAAMLMDTENRVEHKMTEMDVLIMDYVKRCSLVVSDDALYSRLMEKMLSTEDAEVLFQRDYKQDWGFGFAVAKVKGVFSGSGQLLKEELVEKLVQLAKENNESRNLPLTLVKVTDYCADNQTVNKERMYVVAGSRFGTFRATIRNLLAEIIRFEFPDNTVNVTVNYIDFWGGGLQLSRKKTAPILEPLVRAYHRYFYSPSINKWVSRGFLKGTQVSDENVSCDSEGRVNHITYVEAVELGSQVGFDILSLPEYWQVLNDAKSFADEQMIHSLQGANFVEFLSTRVVGRSYLIYRDGATHLFDMPQGSPGLIHPDDIDPVTGFPSIVRAPNEYGNPELWRYWEPDANEVIMCRSYIFLLDQPCLDGKFHPDDSFPNLGVRPVVKVVEEPKIKWEWNTEFLEFEMTVDNEVHKWRYPKKIWE